MTLLPRPFQHWTTYRGHVGIDYPEAQGTPVRASGDGVCTYSDDWSDRGLTKTITYGGNVKVMSCHLVSLDGVQVGDTVQEGDVIGYVGSTGKSTGPHLHQEVWVNGILQNYWGYFSRDALAYVGAETPSGGGDEPFPPIIPPVPTDPKGNTMQPRLIHYQTPNGDYVRALVVPGTKYVVAWTEKSGVIANEIMTKMGTGPSSAVTIDVYNKFINADA